MLADVQNSGYMAPEYAMEGLFSVKSDVFSFGVILLEIISGKRNSGFYITELAPTLLAYVILISKSTIVGIICIYIIVLIQSICDRHGGCGMKGKEWNLWIPCYWASLDLKL